jgi:hypothetical protein
MVILNFGFSVYLTGKAFLSTTFISRKAVREDLHDMDKFQFSAKDEMPLKGRPFEPEPWGASNRS